MRPYVQAYELWDTGSITINKLCMSYSKIGPVLAAIVVIGGVVWFASGTKPMQQTTLSIAQISIAYSAVSELANEMGYFKDNGVAVNVASVAAGPDVVTALRSPSGTTVGTIAVTPVATMVGAGDDPVILATIMTSDEQVQLATFSKNGITDDPATLKGKKIGYIANTNGHIYLSRLLAKGGLTPDQVMLVNAKPADLVNLLVKGDIDAAVIWDPFIEHAQTAYTQQLAEKAVPDRGEYVTFRDKSLYTTAFNIVTTKEKLAANRPAIEAMLRGVLESEAYIKQNPAEAQKKLEAWLKLQPGDLDHFMKTSSSHVALNVPQMTKWLQDERAWLGTVQDIKDTRTDMSQFIDPSVLESIDPSRVTK